MTGLVVKLLVCPIGIMIASWIFPNVNFSSWYQPILIGLALAVVGYVMELLFFREDTKWLMLFLDFILTTAGVYFGAMLFIGADVTFWGAVLTGILIAVTEIFQHNWLLASGRVRKDKPIAF